MRWQCLLLIGVMPIASASAGAPAGCADLRGTPIHFNVSWQADIKPLFNELISPTGRCTSCHIGDPPAGGLDLSDNNFDAIYKVVGSVVQAGSPLTSRLFEKVNCSDPNGGLQMPLGGDPLTIAERELIYDWIAQGAYGEDPNSVDGPIARDFIFRDGSESIR